MSSSTLATNPKASKNEEQRKAEDFLLQVVERASGPLRLRDVLSQRAEAGLPNISPAAIRRALWHLADIGRLDFTADWRVKKLG